MKMMSLKLTASLHARVDRASRQSRCSKSAVVREALMRFLNGEHAAPPGGPVSALELAGDLVGCAEGPRDLSTNPKHMREYGQ